MNKNEVAQYHPWVKEQEIASTDWLPKINNWAIGFDRHWEILNNFHNSITTPSYPPYNIVKIDEDEYVVEMAIAGFSKKDIEIIQQEQTLTIEGKKDKDDTSNYVHRGIAARNFKHTFALADYVEVESADFTDGILSVKIKRELPEEKKPRTIVVK